MSRLTLLGTGTCQIESERRASSVLLELDGTYILFDCGHGTVQRLLEAGVRHNEVEHIVLSHFHPDHVSDIIPFLQAGAWSRRDPRTTDIHIYGPQGTKRLIDGLIDIFGPTSFRQPGYQIAVHEESGEQRPVGPYHFDFVSLPPADNQGMRFIWNGKLYAITGDSYFHEAEIAFLRDVDLAIIDSGHIEDEEIVQLAVSSRAQTLVCSHQYRALDARVLQKAAETSGYEGTILVGRDLMTFVI